MERIDSILASKTTTYNQHELQLKRVIDNSIQQITMTLHIGTQITSHNI